MIDDTIVTVSTPASVILKLPIHIQISDFETFTAARRGRPSTRRRGRTARRSLTAHAALSERLMGYFAACRQMMTRRRALLLAAI